MNITKAYSELFVAFALFAYGMVVPATLVFGVVVPHCVAITSGGALGVSFVMLCRLSERLRDRSLRGDAA